MKIRRSKPVKVNAVTEKPLKLRDVDVELSLEASEPLGDILDYSTLLYGEKKIGKTTLCSMFPDTNFLMFEPGAKALSIRQNPVPTWVHAKKYLQLLGDDANSSKPKIKTVVADTIDIAYQLCFSYMCQKQGIQHPHDQDDFGKSWGEIRKEFQAWVTGLLALNKGVFFLSHADFRVFTRRDGTKYDTLAPSLTGQAMQVVKGLVDNIFYYGYEGEGRVLVLRGDESLDAGTRLEENFLTKVKRRPLRSISMGDSKQEAYANLLAAYNNKSLVVGEVPTVSKPQRSKRKG